MGRSPTLSVKRGHFFAVAEALLVPDDRRGVCHKFYERGRLTKNGRAYLEREQPDICIFGHTHQPKTEWFSKTLLFNPGSAGPKRFKLPRGVDILVLARQGITPKQILLDDKRTKVKPRGTIKSYWGVLQLAQQTCLSKQGRNSVRSSGDAPIDLSRRHLLPHQHDQYHCVMIPAFSANTGNLPPGEHPATWEEIVERFGHTQ
jgi:hypothetical protein